MASTTDTHDHQAVAELLWGLRERPSRGPKPALDIDQIARTAVRIADLDGLTAVSMQRIATDLGFTKMALYRYVTGKAELIAVMIEAAVGEPPDLTSVPGGWRPRLTEYVRLLSATWHQHPWLPWATMGDRLMGPREVGWTEAAVAALADTGLDGTEKMDAVLLISGHIRNTQSTTTSGTQPWGVDKQLNPTLRNAAPAFSQRFPALTAALADADDTTHDRGRQFGLDRILDGIETLISTR